MKRRTVDHVAGDHHRLPGVRPRGEQLQRLGYCLRGERRGARRLPWGLLGAAAFALGAAGCTPPAPSPEELFRADFEQAIASATSDFERSVLEDHVISDAEYDESRERLRSCVADGGYELELLPDGTRFQAASDEDLEVVQEVFDDCQIGTVIEIEPLYFSVRLNPEHKDPDQQMAECLQRAGVVDKEFDGKDYGETFKNPPYDQADARVLECGAAPETAFAK